ncbi:MmyB family transcriptional regulator [Bounagaea algeriensis]
MGAGRQHRRLGVAGPQRVLALHRRDRLDRVRAADRSGAGFGEPEVADLARFDELARALQLDEAERDHLFALARASGRSPKPRRNPPTSVRPTVQHVLDAISDAPAWVRNARHDIVAMNRLARALYSPVLEDPRRPANTARFAYLNPAAQDFFVDWDKVANDAAAMLRLEAGRNPHDKALVELVGELSTQSEVFRQRWASHDVQLHRSGRKRLRHPVVGQLDLNYESMELPSDPGMTLNVHTAPPDSPAADALKMLASWAATQDLGEEEPASSASEES